MLLLLFVTIRTQIKRMGMAQNLYTFLVEELGFVGCVLDPCLLIRRTSRGVIAIVACCDGIPQIASSQQLLDWFFSSYEGKV